MTRREQQRLLSAHAAAERVDAVPVQVQPRQRARNDRRHPRQVVDLPRRAPRVVGQEPSFAVGVDDRERALRRERAPEPRVRVPRDAAAVRRDDEWDRGVVRRPVRGGEDEVRVPAMPVVRAVRDLPDADAPVVRAVIPPARAVEPSARPASASAARASLRMEDLECQRSLPSGQVERFGRAIESCDGSLRGRTVVEARRGRAAGGGSVKRRGARRAARRPSRGRRRGRLTSEYESGPKLVGARSTAIVFPVASQPRGVAGASSRPSERVRVAGLVEESRAQRLEERVVRGARRRQVHRAVALPVERRDGRSLARDERVVVMAPASSPYRRSTSWSASPLSARKRAVFRPYTSSVPDVGNVGLR